MNNSWKTMESAPKDRPILAICKHDEDPYTEDYGKTLTPYDANCEGLSHVIDGVHVLEFGGGYSEYDSEFGFDIKIPDWWFLFGSEFEVAANPIFWCEIPKIPEEIAENNSSSKYDENGNLIYKKYSNLFEYLKNGIKTT